MMSSIGAVGQAHVAAAALVANGGRAPIAWQSQAGPQCIIGYNTQVGNWTTASFNVTNTVTAGWLAGMFVNGGPAAGADFLPVGAANVDTISLVSGSTAIVVTPTKPAVNRTAGELNVSNMKGALTSGSPVVTPVTFRAGSGVTIANIWPGMGIYGNGIPSGTTVVSASGSTIIMSANATRGGQAAVVFLGANGRTTAGSNSVTFVAANAIPAVGALINIVGAGLPAGTTITAAPDSLATYQAGTGTLTLSANTANAVGNSAAGALILTA